MDINYAIRKDEPVITEPENSDQVELHEHWERCNRLSVMYTKTKISVGIHGFVEQHTNVMTLLKAIDNQLSLQTKRWPAL